MNVDPIACLVRLFAQASQIIFLAIQNAQKDIVFDSQEAFFVIRSI